MSCAGKARCDLNSDEVVAWGKGMIATPVADLANGGLRMQLTQLRDIFTLLQTRLLTALLSYLVLTGLRASGTRLIIRSGGGLRVEVMMKAVTALALAAVAAASPAFANTCLRTSDIVSAHSDDGKLMLFQMRNGETLVNHLQGICPTLKFNGFVWVIRGTDTVCENTQSMRVLNSGQVCVLGKFDALTEKPGPR